MGEASGGSGVLNAWTPILLLLAVALAGLAVLYGVSTWLAPARSAVDADPFSGGRAPEQHAFSRFHVRWYPITMIFLAFDMEMLFMYPWVKVVPEIGVAAVVEMFLFLGILFAGVLYAWREGAFRWT
ncbi:NADH-quinone oxidoreductase subunit A [Streptomyces uncialis]|uniref:NADH-quinone oxidoreductase subunit A n=1 Tax=Streptomyces uncialis TaxID=1048205 RepID=UPI003863D5D7|nr:NADH-quinone oxidoreductase subunit A [Streptomyces uncialis]